MKQLLCYIFLHLIVQHRQIDSMVRQHRACRQSTSERGQRHARLYARSGFWDAGIFDWMTNESFARNKSYFISFCPVKRQSTGRFVSFGSFVRPNANPPDVLSFSAIIESTKIRKIHRSGRVYTKATVANELWQGGGRVSFTKPILALAGRGKRLQGYPETTECVSHDIDI